MKSKRHTVNINIGGRVLIHTKEYEKGSMGSKVNDAQDTAAEVLSDFEL